MATILYVLLMGECTVRAEDHLCRAAWCTPKPPILAVIHRQRSSALVAAANPPFNQKAGLPSTSVWPRHVVAIAPSVRKAWRVWGTLSIPALILLVRRAASDETTRLAWRLMVEEVSKSMIVDGEHILTTIRKALIQGVVAFMIVPLAVLLTCILFKVPTKNGPIPTNQFFPMLRVLLPRWSGMHSIVKPIMRNTWIGMRHVAGIGMASVLQIETARRFPVEKTVWAAVVLPMMCFVVGVAHGMPFTRSWSLAGSYKQSQPCLSSCHATGVLLLFHFLLCN